MNSVMLILLWTFLGFGLGSMPFSVWLGRWMLHVDVRGYGDGNPGANVFRAGGWHVGLLAGLLDYLKGAVPVGLAHFSFGVWGWGMLPVALAPVLGHAFSPFLRFRGGKAMATTFGIWTGLTLGEGPIMLGLLLGLFYFVQTNDSWSSILGMLGWLLHLMLRGAEPVMLLIGIGNLAILLWKHRQGLREAIHPRPLLLRLVKLR